MVGVVAVLAAALVWAAVAIGDDNPTDNVDVGTSNPSKQAEVQAAVDSSGALSDPAGSVQYRDPTSDSGPAADVAQVKSDVVVDLQADRAIMSPATVPATLQAQLAGIYSSSVLASTVTETTQAMLAAQADPTYKPYDANTFTVSGWQGVQVNGTTALAVFLGYDAYESPGQSTFEADTVRQWQVTLALEGGRWKLVSQNSIDPADVPTPGGVTQLP
jgi:hypothetical protein